MSSDSAVAIQVRLFADLRAKLGTGAVQLELATPADIPTLLQALTAHFAAAAKIRETDGPCAQELLTASNVRIAVNQRLIEGNVQLASGDEVAFLPPVTGG